MAEENQDRPLAPPQIYRRSDEEYWPRRIYSKVHYNPNRTTMCSKCFICFFTILVLLSVACLVFALVAVRIRYPKLELESVEVRILKYSRVRVGEFSSFNMTMAAEMRLRNSNFGGFKFQNGSISVVHGNTTLGTTNIDGGLVRRRGLLRKNIVVKVTALNLNISDDDDVGSSGSGSDLVKLNSYAHLSGDIRVVKIVRTNRTSFMNCSMNLNLTSEAIQDLRCS